MTPESGNAGPDVPPAAKKRACAARADRGFHAVHDRPQSRLWIDAPAIDPVKLIFVAIIGAALVIAGLVSLAMFIAR